MTSTLIDFEDFKIIKETLDNNKMKATFPSGLRVIFVMYLDIKKIGEHHGIIKNSFYLQKCSQGSVHYVEFRHLLNKLRHKLEVLDPLARQHYAAVRKNGGKSLQKTIEKEHAQYLKMFQAHIWK